MQSSCEAEEKTRLNRFVQVVLNAEKALGKRRTWSEIDSIKRSGMVQNKAIEKKVVFVCVQCSVGVCRYV